MCVRVGVCWFALVYLCVNVCICMCMCVSVYEYVCAHVWMPMCELECKYVHSCVCVCCVCVRMCVLDILRKVVRVHVSAKLFPRVCSRELVVKDMCV